ncbi:hypothetical protein TNCV_330751 [Trichonephila clavipes]|nr:hypothetical protein TNCV_330751 [Trichonephila clavipes]
MVSFLWTGSGDGHCLKSQIMRFDTQAMIGTGCLEGGYYRLLMAEDSKVLIDLQVGLIKSSDKIYKGQKKQKLRPANNKYSISSSANRQIFYKKKRKGHPASFQAKKCIVPDDERLGNTTNGRTLILDRLNVHQLLYTKIFSGIRLELITHQPLVCGCDHTVALKVVWNHGNNMLNSTASESPKVVQRGNLKQ